MPRLDCDLRQVTRSASVRRLLRVRSPLQGGPAGVAKKKKEKKVHSYLKSSTQLPSNHYIVT